MTRQSYGERSAERVGAPLADALRANHAGQAAKPTTGAEPSPATASALAIRIERLILHHLDHRAGRCELVDDEAVLDEESARFFTGHLVSASERADWRARFREGEGDLPDHLTALLGDSARFVAASRALAQRLYDFMKLRAGQIVPGDFVVIAYTAGEDRHVALLKMDPDEQRLTRAFQHVSGRVRVSISRAANLLPETRGLQKCALISTRASGNGGRHFTVRLLDTQAGPKSDGVAAFFYRDFLAATLAASARRQTRLFLSESNAWLQVQATTFSPRDLLAFYAARREALSGERVDLRAFAARALPARRAEADALVTRLTSALFALDALDGTDGVDGGSEEMGDHPFFPVDRAVARKYVEKVTIELDGGARLSVPAARFDSLVRVLDDRDAEGKARLALTSMIFREISE
jgi:nucleoid associated protein NdpA